MVASITSPPTATDSSKLLRSSELRVDIRYGLPGASNIPVVRDAGKLLTIGGRRQGEVISTG
jgi:hypothetical protein